MKLLYGEVHSKLLSSNNSTPLDRQNHFNI
jgi:hypothetical protein